MDARFTPEMAVAHHVRLQGITVAEIGVTPVVVVPRALRRFSPR